jgi:hypothetical protein
MLIQFRKIFFLIIIFTYQILPQSFGFGCFGFVGGYAGYSYQKYEPGYLNEQIKGFNTALSEGADQIIPEFGTAQGYRLGINILRAKFSDTFFSVKGYYEALSENQSYSYSGSESLINSELNFSLKSWNVGVDFGIPISDLLSWKIIEGVVHFNSAKLIHKPNLDDNTKEIKYENDAPEIGYSISTGFIFSIAENFLSIEGTAGYKFFKINQMTTEDGSIFLLRPEDSRAIEEEDFIKAGGFSAVVQLNLGFPL